MDRRNEHARAPGRSTGTGRAARALASVGTLVLTAGLALVASAGSAGATPGDPHKVWVCHATSSDTNPYVAIFVDVASVKYQGHLAHKNDPNKSWKSDGTFRGVAHSDGDPKPDIIFDGLTPEDCADFEQPPPPEQPADVVEPLSEDETTCELGARTREGTLTKEYAWDDEANDWVLEPEAEWETVWGEWSEYRELTKDELAELVCVLGEETIVPKPTDEPEDEVSRTPTVLGTQAAVPSAVAAGSAGRTGQSSTGLVALALAGGLALLVTAGRWGARSGKGGAHRA